MRRLSVKIKNLYDKREKWTQGYLAKNSHNLRTNPNNKNAITWCLVGAVRKCYWPWQRDRIMTRIDNEICNEDKQYDDNGTKYDRITRWNDNVHSFGEVKSLVEKLDI